ncbi:MAG: hypothetical protein GXY38_09060 [Planctomycetes bacterium]|nr:hypothetical protein [Planctomycetota bacterium]
MTHRRTIRPSTVNRYVHIMLLTALAASTAAETALGEPVTIGGIEYQSIDPGPAFAEDPRRLCDWQPPSPSPDQIETGMIIYRADDPGEHQFDRVPKTGESVTRLEASLTPGETCSQWFGAWAIENLEDLKIETTGPAGLEIEIRRIHCWPQRSTWFNSRSYHIVPEMLLKQKDGKTEFPLAGGVLEWRDFDVKKGQSAGMWVTVKASADVPAGLHAATIMLTSNGRKPVNVSLDVTVYPFELPARLEDTRWILYAWPNRYKAGADPMLDINEMVAHGIDGFLDNAYLMVKVSRSPDGSLLIEDNASSINWVKKIIVPAQQAGMRGPFGVWTTPANRELAKALDIDMTKPWPAHMHEGIRQICEYFKHNYESLGINDWMSFASDEPKPGNTYAIEALKAWRLAGAKTYCTAYMGTYMETAEWITDACIGFGDAASRNAMKKNKARHWIIGDGTYIGPYEMARYRRRVGVNFFLSGAYGCAIWRWGGCHGDPFNDFDGVKDRPAEPADQLLAYPQMAEPNNWKTYIGPIPTIGWESIREGINDYKYLHLLELAAKEAVASGEEEMRARGAAVLESLEQMRVLLYQSASTQHGQRDVFKISTRDMSDIRKWAAGEIIHLRRLAFERAAAAGHEAARKPVEIDLSLAAGTVAQRSIFVPPPLASIPTARTKPRIDGDISPAEWLNASRLAIPGSAKTTAMMMHDDENLYVAWRCDEPQMDRVIPADAASDSGPIWPQDSVELFIVPDTLRDKPAHLMINHLGRWLGECNAVKGWNANADVASRHYDNHYVIELALPWKSLFEISPGPWKTVAMNLCRVRNPETAMYSTSNFNWSYGTGGFHQPARFGLGEMRADPVGIVEMTTGFSQKYGTIVSALVRNNGSTPIHAQMRKLRGRVLGLFTDIPAGPKTTVIPPGQARRVSLGAPMKSRRQGWVLRWQSGDDQPMEVAFEVPGMQDISPFDLDQKQHVVGSHRSISIAPTVSTETGVYLRLSTKDWHSPAVSLEDLRQGGKHAFSMPMPAAVATVSLELLDANQSILSNEEITVVDIRQ